MKVLSSALLGLHLRCVGLDEEEEDRYFGWGVGKKLPFYSFLTQPPVPDQVGITVTC